MPNRTHPHTAFHLERRIAHGRLSEVAVGVKHAGVETPVLVFDDVTGKQVDLDTRGTDDEVRARYSPPPEPPRGRGRPKLGVVPREVTLLPRHWEWLNKQPGGASNALRKLVDSARHESGAELRAQTRAAHEAAYHFMHAIAGDFPGYEEATRALFANDHKLFAQLIAHWPHDISAHAVNLAFGASSHRDAP